MPTDRLDRHVAALKRRAILFLLIGSLLGSVTANIYRDVRAPHCPTEDSCAVSYNHGRWTVKEVRP